MEEDTVGHVGHMTGAVRALSASVQGDPVFMRKVNGWLTIFWIVMIPISILMSAWQTAGVEVEQARQAKQNEEEDMPGEIVERIVRHTNVAAEPN